MKSFNIRLAIIGCTLALTACGAGESETDTASIDEVGSSAYQQALGADGQVDCDNIHNALWDNGIDPAQLQPEVVFEACVNSGTPEDICQAVAYSCFGDQGCTDPHPPQPPPVDPSCEEFYQLAEAAGFDPADLGPDEVFQHCVQANYPDDICVQAYQCFPQDPNPQPQPPVCDQARELAEQLNIDVDNMSPEELLNECLDHGYDEQLCWSLIEDCTDPNDPTDPDDPTDPNDPDRPDVSCDEVEQLLADLGIMVSDNADAQVLYGECVQQTNDEAICQAALECLNF